MPTMSPTYLETDNLKICEFIIEGSHYYFIISKPENMKIIPSVEKEKLLLLFTPIENQEKIINMTIELINEHKHRNIK
jgi:hypothetical protein